MKKKDEDDESPSQDKSDRFPLDQLFRERGWRIFERREGEDPVWERGGERVKQSSLLASLREGKKGKKKNGS